MKPENIWQKFNRELGYNTASIQYVELVLRIAKAEHGKEFAGEDIKLLAKEHGLALSVLPEDISNRIAKNYIIQIHSCVEMFLNDYSRLVGSPVNGEKFDKRDDNRLHWTMEKALGERAEEYNTQYWICDYYRFVRNETIHHDDKTAASLKFALSRLSNFQDDKLNAPNNIDEIGFDDQVLFARSARRLIKSIYFDSQYDWDKIVSAYNSEFVSFTGSCHDNTERRQKKTENFLKRFYPVPKEGIKDLSDML